MESIRQSSERGVNPLHNEHLKEGARPIFVSMTNEVAEIINMFDADEGATDVDHYAACLNVFSQDRVTNETSKVGVLSDVDGSNKFSAEFRNCLGVVVVGSQGREEHQSLLIHIDPIYFKGDATEFSKLLSVKLEEIKAKTEEGSMDALIFAGRIPDSDLKADFDYELEHYQSAITKLGDLLTTSLGFEPVVIPPKPANHKQATTVYFDTSNRRLYMAQSQVSRESLQKPFLPSSVHDVTPQYINPHPKIDSLLKGGWTD